MRAAWYSGFGPAAEVLETGEIDAPKPGSGEVRVRLVCSGINPVDIKRRRGGRGPIPASRVVPHFDGAGLIEAVGDGVSEGRLGERVWVYEAMWQRPLGTAAEFVVVANERAVSLPSRTGYAEGACLGIPAMTAHRCVFADGPVFGRTVLVTGGAGAVGGYAIQFAKLGGASVIATVSGDEKAERASNYGADHVINYKAENVSERIGQITGGGGIERIVEVEFGGNLDVSLEVLSSNGIIAAYASDADPEPRVPFYRLVYANVSVRHVLVFGMPEHAKQSAVADISRWLEEDGLRHHIGARFPLELVIEAHEAIERGAFGNIVLDITDE